MKLSSNFFKRPSIGEIRKQYNASTTKKTSILKSESNARLAVPAPAVSNQKKIKAPPEIDADDSQKRQYLDKKVIDFAARNRFKNPAGSMHKANPPRLPEIKQITNVTNRETKDEETEQRDLKTDRKDEALVTTPQNQLKEVVEEPKKEDINLDCVICFNQKADMVCMPCGHSGICRICSIKVCSKEAVCFLCKKPIEQLLQIDLSRTIGDMVIVLSSLYINSPETEN